MSKSKAIANEIINTAKALGWNVSVRNTVMEITKEITPNSRFEFVQADMEYYTILSLMPTTSAGSVWGTDGGGVGAVSAMEKGLFSMKKSGCSKTVLKALEKMIYGEG